jgi:hypothetical protein
MKREPDWDMLLTSQEIIRKAAFALAYSGLFDGWQAVWEAMQVRFGVEQLSAVFDSPFFRLDLDRRCEQGRSQSRVVDCQGMWSSPAVGRIPRSGSRRGFRQ